MPCDYTNCPTPGDCEGCLPTPTVCACGPDCRGCSECPDCVEVEHLFRNFNAASALELEDEIERYGIWPPAWSRLLIPPHG